MGLVVNAIFEKANQYRDEGWTYVMGENIGSKEIDCSHFVWRCIQYAAQKTGKISDPGYATTGPLHNGSLVNTGEWEEITDISQLKSGDVFVHDDGVGEGSHGHTGFIYTTTGGGDKKGYPVLKFDSTTSGTSGPDIRSYTNKDDKWFRCTKDYGFYPIRWDGN